MTDVRHLSWLNFSTSMLVSGEMRLHRVGGPPCVMFFGDGEANRLGLWVECAAEGNIPSDLQRLTAVDIRHVTTDGRMMLEVSTSNRHVFRPFYMFAVAVADDILQAGVPSLDAVITELQGLAELLETKPLLGLERQVGLLGELLVLERLIKRTGPIGLSAWIGPRGEPHDFRLQGREFEVKTTTGTRRIHKINGAQQLIPTPGHTLHLVSVVLAPPGNDQGFSLATQIDTLRVLFSHAHQEAKEFEKLLEACGYRSVDHALYTRHFILRSPMAVAPVDDRLPTLTPASLNKALGDKAARIESVQYDINIEGLESEEGSSAFAVLF